MKRIFIACLLTCLKVLVWIVLLPVLVRVQRITDEAIERARFTSRYRVKVHVNWLGLKSYTVQERDKPLSNDEPHMPWENL